MSDISTYLHDLIAKFDSQIQTEDFVQADFTAHEVEQFLLEDEAELWKRYDSDGALAAGIERVKEYLGELYTPLPVEEVSVCFAENPEPEPEVNPKELPEYWDWHVRTEETIKVGSTTVEALYQNLPGRVGVNKVYRHNRSTHGEIESAGWIPGLRVWLVDGKWILQEV